jgi:hypothetical protein
MTQLPKEDLLAPFRAELYRSVADLSAGGSVLEVVGAIENFSRALAMEEILKVLDRLNKATPRSSNP